MEKIQEILDVSLLKLRTHPAKWLITAVGLARSKGWSNARLHATGYLCVGGEGLREFDFVADAPTTETEQSLEIVVATIILEHPSANAKGVSVHAVRNHKIYRAALARSCPVLLSPKS